MPLQPKGKDHPAHNKLFPKRNRRSSSSPSPLVKEDSYIDAEDRLAKARITADATLKTEHKAACKELEGLSLSLKIISAECKTKGENKTSVNKWETDYLAFIKGTSMSKIVLDGFEEHLKHVKELVPRKASTTDEIRRYELGLRLDRLEVSVDRQMKDKQAPYEAGSSDKLRHGASVYFEQLKEAMIRRGSLRRHWLQIYREILVLEGLVHSGERVICNGKPTFNFEVLEVLDRIEEWTPSEYLVQFDAHDALQLGKFHPVARSQLESLDRF